MGMNDRFSGITEGSKVKLHYSLFLHDGRVVENSQGDDPLVLVVGRGELESGLEQCLYGLRMGQKRRFAISPQQGFGFSDPGAIQSLAKKDFPQDIPLEPGIIIEFTTPGDDRIPGTIIKIGDDSVEVDFNHPLAGREFIFEVEILEVS